VHPELVDHRLAHRLACSSIPQLSRSVSERADYRLTVGVERHGEGFEVTMRLHPAVTTRLDAPDLHGSIP
jgi:hypothetical protein